MYTSYIKAVKELESIDLNVPNIGLDKQNALSSEIWWKEEFTKVVSAIQVHNGRFLKGVVISFLKVNFIDMYGGYYDADTISKRVRTLEGIVR